MRKWIKELDRVLRGEATRLEELQQAELQIPLVGLAVVILLLAAIYGICMGIYALVRPDGPMLQQCFSTMLKVPALYFLTLLVTFPSLYVFNALVGSRLRAITVLKLLVASLAINITVLASLGPIVAFFSISSTSYPFMLLLNVLVFTVSGMLGLLFLLQTLDRIDRAKRRPEFQPSPIPPSGEQKLAQQSASDSSVLAVEPGQNSDVIKAEIAEPPGALDRLDDHVLGKHVKTVFTCWVVVFGLVGSQMSWVLRPFIGAPGTPFEIFRKRGSNFFEAVFHTLGNFFS
jgi:hypothetical protein